MLHIYETAQDFSLVKVDKTVIKTVSENGKLTILYLLKFSSNHVSGCFWL